MGYSLYEKFLLPDRQQWRYRWLDKAKLFGCNEGKIPWLLEQQMKRTGEAPEKWHLDISDALAKEASPNHALVINLKPREQTLLSLYELLDVWGHSTEDWTPLMFRLRGLYIDENPHPYAENDFIRSYGECDEPIFSMLYVNGGTEGGKIKGPFTPPGPSSTNSTLLWPETFMYFWHQARRYGAGHSGVRVTPL